MLLYWSKHGEVACARHAPQRHSVVWIDEGWQPVPESSASYPELLSCEQCRLVHAFVGPRRLDRAPHAASTAERVAAMNLGDHVCLFYEDRREQLAVVTEYVKQGLARYERCLYACDECTVDEIAAALSAAGIDVRREQERGALEIVTTAEAHLRHGRFDSDAMVRMLSEAVDRALAAGYAGLRAAGEMTWLLHGLPGTEHALHYESQMNQFYPTVRAMGLCQYNHGRMPAEPLEGALRTHPHVLVDGRLAANVFYEPPVIFNAAAGDRLRWKLTQVARQTQEEPSGV